MLHWRLIFLYCSTAEFSLELRRNAVLEAERQAQASVDVPYPPLQIVNSVPFCLFSLYLYPLSAPFLNALSSASPPSLFSLLINSLSPMIKTSIFISYIVFTNGTYFCILFHTMTFFLIMHSINL